MEREEVPDFQAISAAAPQKAKRATVITGRSKVLAATRTDGTFVSANKVTTRGLMPPTRAQVGTYVRRMTKKKRKLYEVIRTPDGKRALRLVAAASIPAGATIVEQAVSPKKK
jgi:hypothetical protein